MREHTVKATGAIFVATALHAIAVGNMLPGVPPRRRRRPTPLMTICVDQTEFVVNKLKDRGTHQAYGVVTNAQDFMHVLRFYVRAMGAGARPEPRRRLRLGAAGAGVVADGAARPRWTRVWVFRTLRHEGREWGTAVLSRVDGERRRIYTARYMLAHQGQGAGQVRGVGRGGRAAGRSRRSTSCSPGPTGASTTSSRRSRAARAWFASVRGRRPADGPPRLGARARRSSSASAATSGTTASRSPASATASPRSCSCPTTIPPSRAFAARSRPRGEHVGTATVYRTLEVLVRERPGPGARLRRGLQALRADAGAGAPRAPDLRALRPRGRVPERAAGADAPDHRRRACTSSTSATGSRSTASAGECRQRELVRRCERARRPRASSSPSPPAC